MKIKLTEYFMKRPTLFWSLMTFILIAGVLAFLQMPKLEDPAVSVKQAMVIVPYPGATAHEVELKVAQTMEDELRALPNVKKIKSECQNGMATITVEFQMTVLQKDLEQHFDLLRRKVNDSRSRLPQDCYDPIVIDDMMDVYGIFYAFTGEGYSYPELYKYAKLIRRELLGVKGVKRILITGNRDEVIQITLSKETIARNGIIPTQIMMSLQNAGKTVNAGSYQNDSDRLPLHVSSAVTDEKDIRNLLIRTPQGKTIRLGDIAQIERTYSEPQRNGFFVDGKPALAICLTMEENAIVPDVGKAVEKRLAEIMPQIPVGMEMEKIFFQPDKVDEAISSFMVNLVESVLIVILILIFTMGFRSGLIIGFGLILTIAVSFPILLMCGTTLQRISLGAFIVAMGMLVDNAIVIMDGILIDKARGLGPKTYLYRIGQHTAMPLLGATLIAVSTFLAVYLSPDSAGEYAGDLFLVLCVSLLASWILALTQVPVCAKSWLPTREKKTQQPQIYHSPIHRFIRRTISLLVEYKKTTLATAFILLALCIFGMTKVKNLFFPDFDYKQFIVEYFLPSQTDPDRIRKDLLEMSALLKKNPAIERVAASMGSAPAHYCLVRPMTSGGDCYGELMVDCKDYETVVAQIPAVRKLLRERYPDAYIRIRIYNFSIASSHTVEVEFSGPDPAILRKLSQQAEDIMRRCPYVDPYSVGNNWKPKGKTLTADYVREDALRSGIERSDVGNALLAATDGLPVGVLNDQDRTVLIHLLVRNADGSRITNLNDIPVWSTLNLRMDDDALKGVLTGSTKTNELQDQLFRSVPLGNVARQIRLDWENNYIYRLNGQRAIEAECDPNTDLYEATPAKVVASIQKEIEGIPLPDGYKMRWVGEGELQGEAIGNLMKYLPVTLFIILGILLLLFNSWKKVILILLCFPFVFCGITPALLLFRQPFTFMAIIGMMGLIGMMVKNAIVLVDEINRLQQEEHLHPYHAVVEATVSRVRPVLMASLTTIVGMIPLVNDPMYGSMAITIMGGLTVGTLITLVLLPIFYTALFHIHKPNSMSNPSSKQL
jgi:multidrug efflux pump subunit AcrB